MKFWEKLYVLPNGSIISLQGLEVKPDFVCWYSMDGELVKQADGMFITVPKASSFGGDLMLTRRLSDIPKKWELK